ncbi:MAG TPA: cytochrome c [Burkholderiales bacterium]|nr:cytochrome c [Burkholderiales bacterium]
MKRSGVAAVVALALGVTAGTVFAQAKPEVLVKQRQSAMTLIGKYWGPLGGMAQGKVPYNAEVVQRNAAYLEALAKMPWDGFDPATKDVKSAALPEVYSNQAKFKEAADRLQNETAKLAQVSKSGDENAIKAQLGAVGKSCGGCHNDFRQKQ